MRDKSLTAWKSWSEAKSLDDVELVRGVVVRDEELGRGVELVRGVVVRDEELGRGVELVRGDAWSWR